MGDEHTALGKSLVNLEYLVSMLNCDYTEDSGLWKKYTLMHMKQYVLDLREEIDNLVKILNLSNIEQVQHDAWPELKDE